MTRKRCIFASKIEEIMNRPIYNWQFEEWPHLKWDVNTLLPKLSSARHLHGLLAGRLSTLGFEIQAKATLDALSDEIVSSSVVEGVNLDAGMVRSSLARHLRLSTVGLPLPSHYIDGVVQVMMDAVENCDAPLTSERLFGWHSVLFPPSTADIYGIKVGAWREGDEPMQVVSGAMGHEKVHFEAPPSSIVPREMAQLIKWMNDYSGDPIIKAAIAHLWFVSIHPFDDGNGRIARTLTEMMLARADGMSQRFYSMSTQILKNRKQYYNVLEQSQRTIDVTEWLDWFLDRLHDALQESRDVVDRSLRKREFWEHHRAEVLNQRQVMMVNRLYDGFEGVLTARKWAKMCKCSASTALRDINELIEKNILTSSDNGGRSTHYLLNVMGQTGGGE